MLFWPPVRGTENKSLLRVTPRSSEGRFSGLLTSVVALVGYGDHFHIQRHKKTAETAFVELESQTLEMGVCVWGGAWLILMRPDGL